MKQLWKFSDFPNTGSPWEGSDRVEEAGKISGLDWSGQD